MPRLLEEAAKAGFDHGGADLWRLLLDGDRDEYTRMLRASLEYLAGNPDPLTVKGMAKTPEQESRVREAWRKLVMGLVNADRGPGQGSIGAVGLALTWRCDTPGSCRWGLHSVILTPQG